MKKLGKLHLSLFCAILIALLIGSTQSVSADHSLDGKGIFKDENSINLVSTKDSKYQIHLQIEVRNSQGQLVSITESNNAKYIPREIMDYILDEEFDDKEIIMINKTKFEKIRYMEQSTPDEYSFRTSYTDMLSTWSMNFSANFPEHGIKVLPVFEVYTPHVNLAVDDKFTLHWTILRELN